MPGIKATGFMIQMTSALAKALECTRVDTMSPDEMVAYLKEHKHNPPIPVHGRDDASLWGWEFCLDKEDTQ